MLLLPGTFWSVGGYEIDKNPRERENGGFGRGTHITLPASFVNVVIPTAQETVVGTMDVVVVQSLGEDGESGEENESGEELHDGVG